MTTKVQGTIFQTRFTPMTSFSRKNAGGMKSNEVPAARQ